MVPLEHGSRPFIALMHRIESFWRKEGNDPWTPVQLSLDWKTRVLAQNQTFSIRCDISTRHPEELQVLAVTLSPAHPTQTAKWSSILPPNERTPISGFPITFKHLQAGAYTK